MKCMIDVGGSGGNVCPSYHHPLDSCSLSPETNHTPIKTLIKYKLNHLIITFTIVGTRPILYYSY